MGSVMFILVHKVLHIDLVKMGFVQEPSNLGDDVRNWKTVTTDVCIQGGWAVKVSCYVEHDSGLNMHAVKKNFLQDARDTFFPIVRKKYEFTNGMKAKMKTNQVTDVTNGVFVLVLSVL